MTIVQLGDKEQSILDAAGMEVMVAQQRHREVAEDVEKAQQNVGIAMARLQGAFRSLMLMHDLNPDAHRAEWNAETHRVVITPVVEEG